MTVIIRKNIDDAKLKNLGKSICIGIMMLIMNLLFTGCAGTENILERFNPSRLLNGKDQKELKYTYNYMDGYLKAVPATGNPLKGISHYIYTKDIYRTQYNLDENGRIVSIISMMGSKDEDKDLFESVDLNEFICQGENGIYIVRGDFSIYTYDNEGRISTETVYSSTDRRGPSLIYYYTWQSDTEVLRQTRDFDGSGKLYGDVILYYDSRGNRVGKLSTGLRGYAISEDGNKEVLTYEWNEGEYYTDSYFLKNGRFVESDNEIYVGKVLYEYDRSGNYIRSRTQTEEREQIEWEFIYDEEGYLVEEILLGSYHGYYQYYKGKPFQAENSQTPNGFNTNAVFSNNTRKHCKVEGEVNDEFDQTAPAEASTDTNGELPFYSDATAITIEESEYEPEQDALVEKTGQTDLSGLNEEQEVLFIRERYSRIVENINGNRLRAETVVDGVTAYYDGSDVVSIIVQRGVDGNNYSRQYYLNDNRLIFAYIEGVDAHRLYFKDDTMFRWRYAANAAEPQNAENIDLENNRDLSDADRVESIALSEVYRYLPQ